MSVAQSGGTIGRTERGIRKRIVFAISAGWLKKMIGTIVNFIQIPLLFHYLPDDILGLWFLMIGAQMFIGIFDFGLGQTLQRRIAFAKGVGGADPDIRLDDTIRQNIRDLLSMSQRIYSGLSLVVFIGLWLGGMLYFGLIELSPYARQSLHLAWFIMALGYAANMWGRYVQSTLNGLGDIGYSNMINSVLWILLLAAIWLILVCGGGLAWLAMAWGLKGILLRIFGWLVITYRHPWVRTVKGSWQPELFRTMIKPAFQWWIAIVGTFMLSGANRYFIGGYLGAAQVPDFIATLAALSMVSAVLVEVVGVMVPLISQMWKAGEVAMMRKYINRSTRLSLLILGMIYVFLCVYAREIFELWLGQGHFIGYQLIIILVIYKMLESHHTMLQVPCTAAEDLRFYKYTLLSGIGCVSLYSVFIPMWGLLGVVLAMVIPPLLTINWIMPLMGLKILECSLGHYFREVLLPVIVSVGALTLVMSFYHMFLPGLLWAFPMVFVIIAIFFIFLFLYEKDMVVMILRRTARFSQYRKVKCNGR